MKKVLIIGAQHGNELLGEVLLTYITARHNELLPSITYLTGNIRARKTDVRYIESDMNRSYTNGRRTYEERRATRILRYIVKEQFDVVLDLHTTTCDQPPCLIVPDITEGTRDYIRASSMTNIVLMKHPIVQTSLIGVYPRAVSIEINKNTLTDQLMEEICQDIDRYLHGMAYGTSKKVYEISGPLLKAEISESDAAGLRNFEYSGLGFYPILVGENSYKAQTNYLGFKAKAMRTFKV
jgi:succinylglutamate desuccinylase